MGYDHPKQRSYHQHRSVQTWNCIFQKRDSETAFSVEVLRAASRVESLGFIDKVVGLLGQRSEVKGHGYLQPSSNHLEYWT